MRKKRVMIISLILYGLVSVIVVSRLHDDITNIEAMVVAGALAMIYSALVGIYLTITGPLK